MAAADKIKDQISKPSNKRPISPKDCLSTGSTLLNLACSGRPDGGFPAGYYVYFVGDTDSGKTFICMTCFAEAMISPRFKHYRIIYDSGEFGALMDMGRFFGQAVVDKLEPPRKNDDGCPRPSVLIEEFYFNLRTKLDEGKPFIYVQDSMDVLSSKYEGKKFDEHHTAAKTGKKAKGDFGDGKAKINSRWIRRMLTDLHDSGSILIIINQTRDNPDAGLFEASKTHSGGHALSFYATLKLWSSVRGPIKKTVNKKERRIGNYVRVDVKRSRITGRQRSVIIPIYPSVGIDDLGSCVDFLMSEGYWKKNKAGYIEACDFDQVARSEELIQYIEGNDLEPNLRRLTATVWRAIEEKCRVVRKPRY